MSGTNKPDHPHMGAYFRLTFKWGKSVAARGTATTAAEPNKGSHAIERKHVASTLIRVDQSKFREPKNR